jgi:hypothetical protein
MDPIKFTELTKKYGSTFLMWCAIAFLYSELTSTKSDLKEVQMKLYTCLEIRANVSKHVNENVDDIIRHYACIPKKQKYALKGIKKEMEC